MVEGAGVSGVRMLSEVLPWSDRVELEEQSQDLLNKEELDLDLLAERSQAIRFPKQVDLKSFILLVSNVFKNMAHVDYEKVLEKLNVKVEGLDYRREFNYVDNYVYPEVLMLEAFDKETIDKFNHLDFFIYNGQPVLIVKPMKESVYTAKVVTHFPKISLKPVLDTMKKYAVVLKCVSQTYNTKGMIGIFNGNFIISFKLKKGAALCDIPQLLKFSGFNAKIFIQGQKKRCFRCNGEGHLAFKCAGRNSVDGQHQSRGEIFGEEDFPQLGADGVNSAEVIGLACDNNNSTKVHGEHTYSRVVIDETILEDERDTQSGRVVPVDGSVQQGVVEESVVLLTNVTSCVLDVTEGSGTGKQTVGEVVVQEVMSSSSCSKEDDRLSDEPEGMGTGDRTVGEAVVQEMMSSSSSSEGDDRRSDFSQTTATQDDVIHNTETEFTVVKKNKRKHGGRRAAIAAKRKAGARQGNMSRK